MATGQIIRCAGMTMTIMDLTKDKRPGTVAFRFNLPLEDNHSRWFCYQNAGFVPFTLPAPGTRTW